MTGEKATRPKRNLAYTRNEKYFVMALKKKMKETMKIDDKTDI